MTPDELLGRVTDRASFLDFVAALVTERESAEALEQSPNRVYRLEGELGWANGDIAAYLDAAGRCFGHRPDEPPSWRLFAEFLYGGKVYE